MGALFLERGAGVGVMAVDHGAQAANPMGAAVPAAYTIFFDSGHNVSWFEVVTKNKKHIITEISRRAYFC
jgi:hypothetical protein